MDTALVPHQEGAPFCRAFRQKADDGYPGIRADLDFAIVVHHIRRRLLQKFRHAEQVLGVEENILPVDAAFPALDTVEWKRLVRPYFEGVVMVYDMF